MNRPHSALHRLRRLLPALALLLFARAQATETLVFLRHGEKPAAGLGQLNCRGLQRSLALAKVLPRRFGTPDAIFAPDPGAQKQDGGKPYHYVRPLATIEPTAIALGLPVDTRFGFEDTAGLISALERPELASATVFIAWEHRVAQDVARALLARHGGEPATVPRWESSDFDSLYVVTLDAQGRASFHREAQGLDRLSDDCP